MKCIIVIMTFSFLLLSFQLTTIDELFVSDLLVNALSEFVKSKSLYSGHEFQSSMGIEKG
jgi:hypothetical protein